MIHVKHVTLKIEYSKLMNTLGNRLLCSKYLIYLILSFSLLNLIPTLKWRDFIFTEIEELIMTEEQRAKNKAESEYNKAEEMAKKRGLTGASKWAFICGELQHTIEKMELEAL